MHQDGCELLYLVEFQEYIKRGLKSTGELSASRQRQHRETYCQLRDLTVDRLLLGRLSLFVLALLKPHNSQYTLGR